METAKVDIRKLQLLNDRINQCIDALNQVRLSVHGLSAGAAGVQGGIGSGQGLPFGQELGGLSHSGVGQNPFAQQMGINPALQFGFPSPIGQVPFSGYSPALTQNPFTQFGGGFGIGANPLMTGLAHTGPEGFDPFRRPIWADPYLTARITQTFPYVQLPVPPVVTIY